MYQITKNDPELALVFFCIIMGIGAIGIILVAIDLAQKVWSARK